MWPIFFRWVRWQKELYAKAPRLRELKLAREVETKSQQFIEGYGLHKVKGDDYPHLIKDLFAAFRATADALKPGVQLDQEIITMEKAHRDYLLKLQSVTVKQQ